MCEWVYNGSCHGMPSSPRWGCLNSCWAARLCFSSQDPWTGIIGLENLWMNRNRCIISAVLWEVFDITFVWGPPFPALLWGCSRNYMVHKLGHLHAKLSLGAFSPWSWTSLSFTDDKIGSGVWLGCRAFALHPGGSVKRKKNHSSLW